MKISFSPPDITQAEIDAVVAVLRSGWITTGTRVKEFEERIAKMCKTPKAVCLNSATAGLEQTLRILGIGPGDEVITSAYTYTASASVIAHVSAEMVLVDTAWDSYFMDMDQLEKAITPRTKAIIAVDLGGVMCDYPVLASLAEAKANLYTPANPRQEALGRLAVVADAAHSLGASWGDTPSGSAADFTIFSFHAVKNLTTAEGGAITWRAHGGLDSADLYRDLMLLSLHGQTKDARAKADAGSWEYDIVELGYKCNMTDILAALGLAQMDRYLEILKTREDLIRAYDLALAKAPLQVLPHYTDRYRSTGHLYLTRMVGKHVQDRNRMIQDLAKAGIAANVHYKPLPLLSAYQKRGFRPENFPAAMAQYENELTLPLHSQMTEEQVAYVAETYIRLLEA